MNTPHNLTDGLLLGARDGNAIWDTRREGHLLTIAPTGAGKGISCIIPALFTWQGPIVVVDPRGENYAVTAAHRRRMGHQVHLLDPFRVTGDACDSLNPLDLIDPLADDFEDNAAVIANLIMQGNTFKDDPFWDERAESLIVELIKYLYTSTSPSRAHTLRDVQALLTETPSYSAKLLLEMPDLNQRHNARRHMLNLSGNQFGVERTRASIFSTASSHMGFLRSPAVHGSLQSSTILLDDITAGAQSTVYLVIPPDKLISHGKLLRLWIGVMFVAISRRRRPPPQPTLFLIDETAQLGRMNELLAAITLLRAYGCRVWTFWQDLTQLQRTYAADWESIINNSRIQQFFGASSPHAAASLKRYLADAVPTAPLAPTDLYLFDGTAITTARRPNYLTDRIFTGMAAPNPFYQPIKSHCMLH